VFALLASFEEVLVVGDQPFPLTNQTNIAGLQIQITNANRPMLILQYAFLAYLFIGSQAIRIHDDFISISLIISSLVICGISTTPTIFGILFFQPAIFLSAFLLTPAGSKPGSGVLRFLVFQVIGMTFLLLAGWSISAGVDILEQPNAVQRSLSLFGAGFSFLFAVFPLHTWITKLSEDQHPFGVIFVVGSFLGGYSFLFMSLLENYSWLFEWENIQEVIRYAGALVVISAGFGAAFHRSMGRLFGFAVLVEIGHSLLTISLDQTYLFYALLPPRVFAISLWGLGLSVLRANSPDLSLGSVQGMGRQFPVTSGALILAQFSLSGIPLLAGFPLLLILWRAIADLSIGLAIWIFLGSMGLLIGSLRSFVTLVTDPEEKAWQGQEEPLQISFFVVGVFSLVLMGLIPHWLNNLFLNLLFGFEVINP
jgi:formate hydrogenlyase subunit 3/multisubunit Na+/H+ antiporter MnhD subunit